MLAVRTMDRRRNRGSTIPFIYFSMESVILYLILVIFHFNYPFTLIGYILFAIGSTYFYKKYLYIIQRHKRYQ